MLERGGKKKESAEKHARADVLDGTASAAKAPPAGSSKDDPRAWNVDKVCRWMEDKFAFSFRSRLG